MVEVFVDNICCRQSYIFTQSSHCTLVFSQSVQILSKLFSVVIFLEYNFHSIFLRCILQAAQFGVYKTLVGAVFPVFFSFYMGAWCDLFGRKLIFYIYLTARILEQVVVIICAILLLSPKEYLLFASLPQAFAGGYGVWIMAINAFIADISPPDTLAFRYGMLHLASSLGRTIAPPVGAYLFTTGGYTCVFTASLVGTSLGALFLTIRVRSFKWTPKKSQVIFF